VPLISPIAVITMAMAFRSRFPSGAGASARQPQQEPNLVSNFHFL
jgi:hypothetical protein